MHRLLIVDDDSDVSEALSDVLTAEHNFVRLAHNGEEGLRALDSEPADAILLDVEMPVLDGPGMVDRIRKWDRGLERIPIVLVSGVADVRRIAASVGTPYYLKKPYELSELFAVLDRALHEPHAAKRDTRGDLGGHAP